MDVTKRLHGPLHAHPDLQMRLELTEDHVIVDRVDIEKALMAIEELDAANSLLREQNEILKVMLKESTDLACATLSSVMSQLKTLK
jgi:hypothetical protein